MIAALREKRPYRRERWRAPAVEPVRAPRSASESARLRKKMKMTTTTMPMKNCWKRPSVPTLDARLRRMLPLLLMPLPPPCRSRQRPHCCRHMRCLLGFVGCFHRHHGADCSVHRPRPRRRRPRPRCDGDKNLAAGARARRAARAASRPTRDQTEKSARGEGRGADVNGWCGCRQSNRSTKIYAMRK